MTRHPSWSVSLLGSVGLALAVAVPLRVSALPAEADTQAAVSADVRLEWSDHVPLPHPRIGFAAATAGDGSIVVTGGDGGLVHLRDVQILSPGAKRWKSGPPLPSRRYGHASVAGSDGRVYVIGGHTVSLSGLLSEVLVLERGPNRQLPLADDPDLRWEPVAPLPSPRQHLAAARGADGRIYVVGGSVVSRPVPTLEIYDPAKNRWTTGRPMPTARNGLAAALGSDGRIHAIGGCPRGDITNAVEAYDPRTDVWTPVAPLLTRRCAVDGVQGPDGRIYVVAGTDGTPDTRHVEVFTVGRGWQRLAPPRSQHSEGALVFRGSRLFVIGGSSTVAVESAAVLPSAIVD